MSNSIARSSLVCLVLPVHGCGDPASTSDGGDTSGDGDGARVRGLSQPTNVLLGESSLEEMCLLIFGIAAPFSLP